MQNRIDAVLSSADKEAVLTALREARSKLSFLIDLTPDERKTLFKMGESGRPFVEGALNLVESDDSFMPRSFDKTEMRQDNELYEALMPVYMELAPFFDAVEDTMMLVGSDLIMSGLDVYKNAKNNGRGENLDDLVPLLGRRFKRKSSGGDDEDNNEGGENPQG
jgi:hypothetical protein